MEVQIKSIDNLKVDYRGRGMVADIDFVDDDDVIKEFGAESCVKALDETEVYAAQGGWENAKTFYAEEIEELVEARLAELAQESERVPEASDNEADRMPRKV